ncbi:hypothetical protein K431DRAFT_287547 [Polychaeton citri CBS 116435]|uniref:Zn(2)-C6 fungal-type domain-containing protein n=1 Tax=Polychaeton citri CBS 116435 TaxID=1314669 RepID=A0A9P4Q5R3_9PEZI|nr:hypothetical protein K431DRAFT_287547 [Polychaeton citri CBS 116435]
MPPSSTDERPAKRKKVSAACEVCRSRKVRCDGSRPACKPCRDRGNIAGCHYTAQIATFDESRERYIEDLEDRIRRLEQSASGTPSTLTSQVGYDQHHTPGGYSNSSQQPTTSTPPHAYPYPSTTAHLQPSVRATASDGSPILPPKHVADHLLSVYWEYLEWMYPCTDRNATQAAYDALWSGAELNCDRRLFLCAINAIFACSIQVVNEHDAANIADIYFRRARSQLDLDVISNWSVQLVQTLILCTQYLQSADEPQRCKSFCTLAVRTAQGVGLHLPSTSEAITDPVQRQVVRRLWHCCVIYDKVIALSLSQPPMLSPTDSEAVPLPEDAPGSPYTAFIRSIPLYHRVHVVVLEFYNSFKTDTGALPALNMAQFITQEAGFAAWENSLPERLQFDTKTTTQRSFGENIIAAFLLCRYIQIRIVFLRPALSTILQQSDEPQSKLATQSVKDAALTAASVACFESAQAMLSTIYNRIQASRPGRPCSIWWLDVYFAYTAATVVLASKFTPSVSRHIDAAIIDRSVQQYNFIFQHHSQQHRAAARCFSALTKISSRAGSTTQMQTDSINSGPMTQKSSRQYAEQASPIHHDAIQTTTDTNHALARPDIAPAPGPAVESTSPPTNFSVIENNFQQQQKQQQQQQHQQQQQQQYQQQQQQQQHQQSLAQPDTLDFASWLATAPLDFESSNWEDWLTDLDARYPNFDFGQVS